MGAAGEGFLESTGFGPDERADADAIACEPVGGGFQDELDAIGGTGDGFLVALVERDDFLDDPFVIDVGDPDVEIDVLHVEGTAVGCAEDKEHAVVGSDAWAVHESGGDLGQSGAQLGIDGFGADAQGNGGQFGLGLIEMVVRFRGTGTGLCCGLSCRWGGCGC